MIYLSWGNLKCCCWEHSFCTDGSVKIAPQKIAPQKIGPWKIAPEKIATYENTYPWKFSLMKFPLSENPPLKILPKKITPRKLTETERNWKLLPYGPYIVMKNKAWWPVWWSWVSWIYRYLFHLAWIVVVLYLMSNNY